MANTVASVLVLAEKVLPSSPSCVTPEAVVVRNSVSTLAPLSHGKSIKTMRPPASPGPESAVADELLLVVA